MNNAVEEELSLNLRTLLILSVSNWGKLLFGVI